MLPLYSPLEVTVCVSVDFNALEKLQTVQRWMDGANVQYAAERITYTGTFIDWIEVQIYSNHW